MNLKVTQGSSNEKMDVTLPSDSTGFSLLEELDLNPDEVILLKDGSPIPIDEPLHEGDVLKILVVVSGG